MTEKFESLVQQEQAAGKLSERLIKVLKGAEVENLKSNAEGKEYLKIKISDRLAFNEILDTDEMVEIFGKALLQFWAPKNQDVDFDLADPQIRDQAKELLRDGDLSVSDSIYIEAENGKLVSFLCGAEINTGPKEKDFFINAGFIAPEKRKQGLAKELNYLFEGKKYPAIMSTTISPAAVVETLKVAKANGYDGFYCGHLDGELGKSGTKAQEREIAILDQIIRNLYVKAGLAEDSFKMPHNFIVVNENQGMEPIKKEELKFKPGDPLRETFEQEVLKVQEQFAPNQIYGILICLRKD